jgi:hypothetical protein
MGAYQTSEGANLLEGLLPPIIKATGSLVAGGDIEKLRLQNKWRRQALWEQQGQLLTWTTHHGDKVLPPSTPLPKIWWGDMCSSGIATSHPVRKLLTEWSQFGCSTKTRQPWAKEDIWEAVHRGPLIWH